MNLIESIERAYARVPKPVRFVLSPVWTILFLCIGLPLYCILRPVEALINAYKRYE